MKYSIESLLELAGINQIITGKTQILNGQFNITNLIAELFSLIERWNRIVGNVIIHPSLETHLRQSKKVEYSTNYENFSRPKFLFWGAKIIFNTDVPTDHIIVVAEVTETDNFCKECIAVGLVDLDLIERMEKLKAFI